MTASRIQPLSNRRRKELSALTQKKYRDQRQEMLVEGVRSVEAAVEAGAPIREFVVTEESLAEPRVAAFLDRADALINVVSAADLKSVSAVETSQGVLAVVAIELLPAARLGELTRVLALDGIQDPGNAGTIIRTAAWFGIDAVVTAPGTVDLYNPKVIRSAMGGLWDVPHAEVDDLSSALELLRRDGFVIYGGSTDGASIDRWRPSDRSILVLGSEAHGLSSDVEQAIDERIAVQGSRRGHATESLNVGVAAGILLYEWTKNSRSKE